MRVSMCVLYSVRSCSLYLYRLHTEKEVERKRTSIKRTKASLIEFPINPAARFIDRALYTYVRTCSTAAVAQMFAAH
jgi:hypothetical protein